MLWTGLRKRLPGLAGAATLGLTCLAVLAGCSALLRPPGDGTEPVSGGATTRAGGARRAPGKAVATPTCPALPDSKAIDQADWEQLFALDPQDGKRLRTALVSAMGIQSLSAKLEGELRTACAGIAKDLGVRGDTDSVESACTAAARAITDNRARLGKRARVSVVYAEPRCALPADAIAACLARCQDGAAQAGRPVPIDCPPASSLGTCRGKCTGSCDVTDGMVCDGRCHGGCDWGFRGSCDGACVGTCNGRTSRGYCGGRCVGVCNGTVQHGTCKGRCTGVCEMSRPGACVGTCVGRCSIPFSGLRCEGIPKTVDRTAEGDAACHARCDADLSAGALCTLARLNVAIDHSKQVARARRLAETLQLHLPLILKIAVGMKGHAGGAARSAQAALQAGEDLVSDAGSRGLPTSALTACAAAPLRSGRGAIGNVNMSVRLAIEVKAAVDATDNAGGHYRG